MAILWFDGFDQYRSATSGMGVADFRGNYTSTSGNGLYVREASLGGLPALIEKSFFIQETATPSQRGPLRAISADVVGTGFHFIYDTLSENAGIVSFLLSNGQYISVSGSQGSVFLADTDTSSVSNGTLIGTFSSGLAPETWAHLEFKLDLPNETFSARVNGTEVGSYSLSGLSLSSLTCEGVRLGFKYQGSSGADINAGWDNWYIWDSTGAENNDWMGERNVYTLFPDSDSSPQDWTPSAGSTAWEILDNVGPGSDYVEADTVNDTCTVGLENLPSTDVSISAVAVHSYAAKTGTSATEISLGVPGSHGASHSLLQDEYTYFHTIYETNPDTTSTWEPAEVNNLKASIERTV